MELQEIKKELPRGAIKKIAKQTNLTVALISKFFNGKIGNSTQKTEILQAAADVLAEYKAKERKANAALQKALKA